MDMIQNNINLIAQLFSQIVTKVPADNSNLKQGE